jgi:hypothetical protein
MSAERRGQELHHWLTLSAEQQHAAIKNLSDSGFGDYAISSATGIAVEQVRRILGSRRIAPCEGCGDE